jgi:DNA-binding CsgD family transcriptional regulator
MGPRDDWNHAGTPPATGRGPGVPLSPREEEILRMVALSQTHRQIAAKFGVTLEEAMTLKAEAMEKAGLASRVHVMAYAQERGWIGHRTT